VKDKDNVRIVYLSEKTDKLTTLASFTAPATDITFSNKEMFINRFKNWNANLYNLAIFKTGLSDVDISTFYAHVKGLHSKFADPKFKEIVKQYNTLVDQLKCPFDKQLCDSCAEVSDWTDMLQVMKASKACKTAIAAYCQKNPKASFCKCWDVDSVTYAEEACTNIRGIISDNLKCSFESLDKDQLQAIKTKYNLVENKDVPKLPEQLVEYDDEYTFDKIKIKYAEDETVPMDKIPMNKPLAPLVNATNPNQSPSIKAAKTTDYGNIDQDIKDIVNDFEKSEKKNGVFAWLLGRK
jgi:hypothetical protein